MRVLLTLICALAMQAIALIPTAARASTPSDIQYTFFLRSDANSFDLAGLTALSTGPTPGYGLLIAKDTGPYAVRFDSTLEISEAGTYDIRLKAGEAARAYINGVEVVRRGFPDAPDIKKTSVDLVPGSYPVLVEYFGDKKRVKLDVEIKTPEGETNSLQQTTDKAKRDKSDDAPTEGVTATPELEPMTDMAGGENDDRDARYAAARRFSDLFGNRGDTDESGQSASEMNVLPGLMYQYFTGNGSNRILQAQGTVANIDPGVMTQPGAGTAVFRGFLNILEPGDYLLTLRSEGFGSVSIDGRIITRGAGQRIGLAALGVGLHRIELLYRKFPQGAPGVTLMLEGPNLSGPVPDGMLFRETDELPDPRALTIVSGTGSGLYQPGAMVEITANAPEPGMTFDAWSGPDAGLLANASSPSTALAMPDRDVTLTATYEEALENTFQLSVVGGSGDGQYTTGQEITITADPATDPEQGFTGWAVSGAGAGILADANAATTTLTMPGQNVTVTAQYEASSHELVVNNGSGSGSYAAGDIVVISADPPGPGQAFSQWTGNTGNAGTSFNPFQASTTVTVPTGGLTLTATYQSESENIQISLQSPGPNQLVDEKGFTVKGVATSASGITQLAVNALAGANADPVFAEDQIVAVGPDTGAWAFRFFDEDIPTLTDIQIVVKATNGDGEVSERKVPVRADALERPLEQLLNRIAMGVTPEMVSRARTLGYDAFLAQQLAPDTLKDKVRDDLDPDKLLKFPENRNNAQREAAAYQLRWLLTTERTLNEMLTVYHDNHFNTMLVDSRYWPSEYEEILGFRQHALGRFRDLLDVSAKSAAMMNYLNNNQSKRGNINENYARELLELHTVGVETDYGPDDIIAVARILTGWKTEKGPKVGDVDEPLVFEFDPGRHDEDDKFVPFLDKTYAGLSGEAGIQEGEAFLSDLAIQPRTAAFNCGKLIQLFVNDVPPEGLQDECENIWLSSGGNIGAVTQTILTSPEFRIGAENYRAKFKTPLEYVVSLILTFGVEIDLKKGDGVSESDALRELINAINSAGQTQFQMPVPTGYSEIADSWASSGSMVERFDFALRVFRNSYRNKGLVFDGMGLVRDRMGLETPEQIATYFMSLAMGDRYSKTEYDAVITELLGDDGTFDITTDESDALERAFALMATLPSFQYQ